MGTIRSTHARRGRAILGGLLVAAPCSPACEIHPSMTGTLTVEG